MASHSALPLCKLWNRTLLHCAWFCNNYIGNISNLLYTVSPDLSGSQDGSVRLWEFSHAQPVSVPRPSGTFAKVSRIRFHRSKFGVSDGTSYYFKVKLSIQNNYINYSMLNIRWWKIESLADWCKSTTVLRKYFLKVLKCCIIYFRHKCSNGDTMYKLEF